MKEMATVSVGFGCWVVATVAVALLATAAPAWAARPPLEAAVAVNVKRAVHRSEDLFLGLQVDPADLLAARVHSVWGSPRALTLARGLAPAYLRVAGPSTDGLLLGSSGAGASTHSNVTEAEWLLLTRFCSAAGLRPAVGVSAAARLQGAWDPRPALPLLGLAASLGCDLTLHLGFEPQECPYMQPPPPPPSPSAAAPASAASIALSAQALGAQCGRDVVALRRLLDAFPQCAARAKLLGPDVTRLRGSSDVAFVRAALDAAAPAHTHALSWHPSMWEAAEGAPEGTLGPKARPRPLDQLLAERDAFLRLAPRSAPSRHPPLWVGEPWAEAEAAAAGMRAGAGARRGAADAWEAALRWARRLGLAARLGAAVATHVFPADALIEPPPDYWVSLVHRRLVGDGVFEARLAGGGRRLDVFCRCAARPPGALLVMAVNGGRARVRLSLKGVPAAAHSAGHVTGASGAAGAPQVLQYILTYRDG